ncbi:glutamate-cysteine ligase family protein [Gillisia hiemivivida]|uniref:Glutamate--cysteine ligase n=1 Tax=Gillisia hiemivivida TaxID=291190 RepID=A0A5C6ZXH0_9FLAO|nr:glutamate-cysteine ligase family protein [Gillisia hiemivivida]TXD94042.1 glutamate--cysteine ligase [Gillisia hiemivivida]
MSYRLFEVFGIELEYMLVKSSNLKITPIVDKLMILKNGSITSDVSNGKIEWSNELVAHVVELKTNGPTKQLEDLDELFHKNIKEINKLLLVEDAKLMPSASHPLMDPEKEMKLWEHHYSEIYALYNKIFDCRGHGWSNVQSMHLNLPFYGDEEFEKLHAAIRILLPIIPALSASSPIFEGKNTGFLDSRMEVYKTNQKEIPEMTGKVIPEQVFNKDDYKKQIFDPINKAIAPFDTDNILDKHFLNSRGAIARFDRNAIEIRVIDIQECPKADIAIAVLIIETLKLLVSEELVSIEDQKNWHEDELFAIFNDIIEDAENTQITNSRYLNLFDVHAECTAGELWETLYERVSDGISPKHRKSIEFILSHGSLATRIQKGIFNDYSPANINSVYSELVTCLETNNFYKP